MERGVFSIAGFLGLAKELRILWSSPYLSRLLGEFRGEMTRSVSSRVQSADIRTVLSLSLGLTARQFWSLGSGEKALVVSRVGKGWYCVCCSSNSKPKALCKALFRIASVAKHQLGSASACKD